MVMPKDPIKAEETRKKMSDSHRGVPLSDSHKASIKKVMKIIRVGYKPSQKCRDAQIIACTGVPLTKEHKEAISNSLMGRVGYWSIEKPFSKEHRDAISRALTGIPKPPRTKEHSEAISIALKGVPKPKNSGSRSHFWKGGIAHLPYCEKFNSEFKERVRVFFEYTCVECGNIQKETGGRLHVHHVWYNKKSCCDDTPRILVALCHSCHSKTNFNRNCWSNHFQEIIDKKYNGKCYLTKEEMKNYLISKNLKRAILMEMKTNDLETY